MRKLLIPVATAATLLSSVAAFADTSTGTLASIVAADGNGSVVTLSNGQSFTFNKPPSDFSGFRTGDTVAVNWAHVGTGMAGNSLSAATDVSVANTAIGIVAMIEPFADNQSVVVLTNGAQFLFDKPTSALENFKPGDRVSINWTEQSSGMAGISIGALTDVQLVTTAKGTIAELSPYGQDGTMVTFADGSQYAFGHPVNAFTGFKVGDVVTINYTTAGHGLDGITISPVN